MNKKICVVGAGDWGQNHIKISQKWVVLRGLWTQIKKIKINIKSL